jgi:hypothetical protein
MPDREVQQIKHQIEHSPTSRDGHVHNLDHAYDEIAHLQQQDGGLRSGAFRHDMANLNHQLHAEGLMPNLEIVGVDQAHHKLITRDIADHQNREQSPAHVNDFGALGSGSNPREAMDAFRARMLGLDVTRLPGGGYDVDLSRYNAQAMAGDYLATVFRGLMGGGGDDRSSGRSPLGMNWWERQAWNGWPSQPNNDQA